MTTRQKYDLRVWCQTCSGVIGVLEGIERRQGDGTATGMMVKPMPAGSYIGVERLLRAAISTHESGNEHRRAIGAKEATR